MTERKEKPVSMNAFELISRSQGFNLENLFEKQMVCYFRILNLLLLFSSKQYLSKNQNTR